METTERWVIRGFCGVWPLVAQSVIGPEVVAVVAPFLAIVALATLIGEDCR